MSTSDPYWVNIVREVSDVRLTNPSRFLSDVDIFIVMFNRTGRFFGQASQAYINPIRLYLTASEYRNGRTPYPLNEFLDSDIDLREKSERFLQSPSHGGVNHLLETLELAAAVTLLDGLNAKYEGDSRSSNENISYAIALMEEHNTIQERKRLAESIGETS